MALSQDSMAIRVRAGTMEVRVESDKMANINTTTFMVAPRFESVKIAVVREFKAYLILLIKNIGDKTKSKANG